MWCTTLENKITFWKKLPSRLRVKAFIPYCRWRPIACILCSQNLAMAADDLAAQGANTWLRLILILCQAQIQNILCFFWFAECTSPAQLTCRSASSSGGKIKWVHCCFNQNWSLFLAMQLTLNCHWFCSGIGSLPDGTKSLDYLNWCWPTSMTMSPWSPYDITRPQCGHCGLAMPYGDIDLGQLRLRKWLVACWHKAITGTNLSSKVSLAFTWEQFHN